MTRLAVLLSLSAVLTIPGFANAATVTLSDYTVDPFSNNATTSQGTGGPFLATTGNDGGLLGNNVSFMTFCLEFGEHFSYGVEYTFTLDDKAMNGGVVPAGTGDPVNDETKWLYYQVRLFTDATSGNEDSFLSGLGNSLGANVQEAIWYIEGERTLAEIGGIGSNSYSLVTYATQNQNWLTLQNQGYRVWAMNLAPTGVQDQLAMTFVAY